MTWKRVASRALSEAVATVRCARGGRPGFRVLLYHAVGSQLPHDSYGISIAPDLFGQHMAALAREQRFKVVEFEKLPLSQDALYVALTFDDGYRDNLRHAAPVLLKHRIPFTVFVTSSFVESRSPIYLTPQELRELARCPGVTIGSHGVSHQPLTRSDDAVLARELEDSRRYLESVVDKPVTVISYPHGSVDARVVEAARRAGYTMGACSRHDINGKHADPMLLCRTEILACDSTRVFLQKVNGAWDWRSWLTGDKISAREVY